jgi:5'-3' exonuclease
MKNLSYEDKATGIIFGFLDYLLYIANRFGSVDFVFTWDSTASDRKEIYPPYKERGIRSMEDKELDDISYPQFLILRTEILPLLGFHASYIQTGKEADDLIASLTINSPEEQICIISSDQDLYQLLTPNVGMFSIRRKAMYTYDNFKSEFGIEPNQWSEVKALAGCKTDCIGNISGIGEKTAIQYLTDTLKTTSKAYQAIKDNLDIYRRNLPLVRLPMEGTDKLYINGRENTPSLNNFVTICEHYGFRSFLRDDKLNEWKGLVFNAFIT